MVSRQVYTYRTTIARRPEIYKRFYRFSYEHKLAKDLVLYGLKFEVDHGQAFYISTPLEIETDLKKWLAHYNAQVTFRPNLNLLYHVAGGNGELNQ